MYFHTNSTKHIVTLRNQLDKFRIDFQEATTNLLEAEENLWKEGSGFFDKKLLDELTEARTAYNKAESEYQKFLTDILNKKLNIDAEI